MEYVCSTMLTSLAPLLNGDIWIAGLPANRRLRSAALLSKHAFGANLVRFQLRSMPGFLPSV